MAPRKHCASRVIVVTVTALAFTVAAGGAALASTPPVASFVPAEAPLRVLAAAKDLNSVISSITTWLAGISAAVATLFLTVGGFRYLMAGGDPGEVSRAKDTLKYAAIGYGVAILAPVLLTILKSFVGG